MPKPISHLSSLISPLFEPGQLLGHDRFVQLLEQRGGLAEYWPTLLAVGVILGVVSSFVKPVVKVLSIPFIILVLGTINVNPELIGIILGVDRILDMCRTTVNVTGDLTAAVYVARTERTPPQ